MCSESERVRFLTQVGRGVLAFVSAGADTEANNSGGGALQLLEHAILLDAARDDDGGGDAEPPAPEVDPLGRLRALELVDLKRVTIDTAKGKQAVVSGADTKQMLRGGGALEVGDLCLVENGSKRSGTLGSDLVLFEAASEGQDGKR
eukprot:scaffold22030_cov66-Phaeocystis_antarctica.AAC.2